MRHQVPQLKMLLPSLAGLNTVILHRYSFPHIAQWNRGPRIPPAARNGRRDFR
jgi:hypothetical protein